MPDRPLPLSDRVRLIVLASAAVVALGIVNSAILGKEQILRDGDTVMLRLAPRDPRSLLQGDYMALRYAMENDVAKAAARHRVTDGRIVVALDDDRVATFVALYDGQELEDNQQLLRFRKRGDSVRLASESFFFEEGQGETFQGAAFGELKVSSDGDGVLVGLRLSDLRRPGEPGVQREVVDTDALPEPSSPESGTIERPLRSQEPAPAPEPRPVTPAPVSQAPPRSTTPAPDLQPPRESAAPSRQPIRPCAGERTRCNFAGVRMVFYGADNSWVAQEHTDGVDCNNRVFGDPLFGKRKACYATTRCATEWELCMFQGTRKVFYGAGDSWIVQEHTHGAACNNEVFTDPSFGVAKACFVSD